MVAPVIPETKRDSVCVVCRVAPAVVERRTLPLCAACNTAIGDSLHFLVRHLKDLEAEFANGSDFEQVAEALDLLNECRYDLGQGCRERWDATDRESPGPRLYVFVDDLIQCAWREESVAELLATMDRADTTWAAKIAAMKAAS